MRNQMRDHGWDHTGREDGGKGSDLTDREFKIALKKKINEL